MELGDIYKTRKITNVNVKKTSNSNNVNVNNVRAIAMKLATTLKDECSLDYFLKVAWHVPEATIWSNLEQAQRGRNPRAYFTFLCNMELQR